MVVTAGVREQLRMIFEISTDETVVDSKTDLLGSS